MMQKVFDFLKMLRTLDKNAEAATKELLPGLEITHQECSFDPASPWYDCEFKYLGEVFTLRYLVTDNGINNCCILELIHDGNCIDIPCDADSNIKQFILDTYFVNYQHRIEEILGRMFFWTKSEVGDSNEEFEVRGTIGDDTVGCFGIVFYVHPTSKSCTFAIFDNGEKLYGHEHEIPLEEPTKTLLKLEVNPVFVRLASNKHRSANDYARFALEKIFDFCPDDERDGMVKHISGEFVERYIKDGTLGGTAHYIDTNDCDAKVFALEVMLLDKPFIIKFKRYDNRVAVIARTGTISAPGSTPHVVANLEKLDQYLIQFVSGLVKGTKELYIEAFNKRLDKCAEIAKKEGLEDSFEVFNDIATPAEIVGYYLATYGNEAFAKWKENTKGGKCTETMDAIDAMFLDLPCQVTKKAPCPFCSGEKVKADFSDAYMMRGDAANIMVVYNPNGMAQAKFTIKSCPVCKKDLED